MIARRITKPQRLVGYMRAGDWRRALSLANTFRMLGTHRDTIRLGPRLSELLSQPRPRSGSRRRRRHRGAQTTLPREDGTMNMHKSITPEWIMKVCERHQQSLDNPGFCITCGAEAEGVEPDRRNTPASPAALPAFTAPSSF